jgi:hypothetical protein
LPDVTFAYQKIPIWVNFGVNIIGVNFGVKFGVNFGVNILKGFGIENGDKIYGHFSHFGMLCQNNLATLVLRAETWS